MKQAITTFLLMGSCAWGATTPRFEANIKPVLNRYCFQCHGGAVRMGELDLRSPSLMIKGGTKGAALVAGSAEKSLLFQRISDKSMPMGPDKLTDEEVGLIEEWINAGAPADESEGAGEQNGVVAEHWSFRPVRRPDVPQVHDAGWVRTPIDSFILRALEARGIQPAPPADRITLLRRLYFTLIGLPPGPEEVKAFLDDRSPDALDQVVEQLLAKPQYGERWARHWLDVVRYAESNGYERDGTKPSAWRYRDYVIDSFNRNKPFDRFLTEQTAGDEIEGSNAETQIATTFLRLGLWDDEPADPLLDRYDQLDDVLAATSSAFLGLTLRCARCHDHKFEPLTQKDYYRVLAVFEPLQRPLRGRSDLDRQVGTEAELAAYQEAVKKADDEVAQLQRLVTNLKRGLQERMLASEQETLWQEPLKTVLAFRSAPNRRTKEEKDLLSAFERKLEKELLALASPEETEQFMGWTRHIKEANAARPKEPPRAYVWEEKGTAVPPTHLFNRGNPREPLDEVQPGVPAILDVVPFEGPKPAGKSTGRRLRLAHWMTRPDNPLVARVIVNRIWQWHFGEGLVTSANDFGVMGQRPAYPELLDFLASEFVRSGWDIKALHRLIVKSNTFQLSSAWDDDTAKIDIDQSLLWRWKPRRHEAEAIRDSMLAVSGQLNPEMHGPSIYPDVPAAVLAGQSRPGDGWGKSNERQASRRSIYIFAKRGLPVPELDLLDAPDSAVSCEARRVSTTGPQALTLLNGAFSLAQARHLAERLIHEAGPDARAQVWLAYSLAFSREPRQDELRESLAFLAQQKLQIEADSRGVDKHAQDPEFRSLQDFCMVLLNTNEFFYLN